MTGITYSNRGIISFPRSPAYQLVTRLGDAPFFELARFCFQTCPVFSQSCPAVFPVDATSDLGVISFFPADASTARLFNSDEVIKWGHVAASYSSSSSQPAAEIQKFWRFITLYTGHPHLLSFPTAIPPFQPLQSSCPFPFLPLLRWCLEEFLLAFTW